MQADDDGWFFKSHILPCVLLCGRNKDKVQTLEAIVSTVPGTVQVQKHTTEWLLDRYLAQTNVNRLQSVFENLGSLSYWMLSSKYCADIQNYLNKITRLTRIYFGLYSVRYSHTSSTE
jgi:hypothetical protein